MDKEVPIFVLSTYIITASIITYHCCKETFKLKKNKLESKVTKLKSFENSINLAFWQN